MPKEQINVASVGPTAAVTRRTLFMNVMKPREAKAKAKNKKKNTKRVTNHKRIQANCNPFARRIQINVHVCVCVCAYCSWAIKMEKKSNL